jgi:TolB-like protein/DNA-binding winged helix-turn-helix (wHTH) protein/tetratricopeptide (TPR) repeat protein
MQRDSGSSTRLRFGVFEADLRLGELTKLGKRVKLQEQPFQVLAMLLQNAGELVTRDELRSKLWPQTIVDFDHGVNKSVSKIRDALGDSADNPRFIETIPGRGYRFLADVVAIEERPAGERPIEHRPAGEPASAVERATLTSEHASAPPPRPFVGSWRAAALVLFIAVVVGVGWVIRLETRPAAALRSLAVLPFRNLSSDVSQEYFADGMTDELITDLGQVSALRVISRTSAMTYKDTHKPLAEIARELNVEAVVEGSVMRQGDEVRITAQLIRVPADEHIWAHSYEGSIAKTLVLQRDVARAIVDQIGATLTQTERRALGSPRPVNPVAYEAYLKGRYFWNKRTKDGLAKSIEQFSQAVQTDPGYAQAYSGLADAYALSGDWEYGILSPQDALARSREAAVKALSLDDSLAEAHTSLALSFDLYGWEWDAAEREYNRALQLNPGYATAHQWYAWHLLVTGRDREALLELRMAESLDPLSLIISADLADALCIAGLCNESVRQSMKTLEIDPNFALGHYQLGQAYERRLAHQAAIDEFNKAIALAGHNDVFDSNLAFSLAMSGRKKEATAILTGMQTASESRPSAQANIALIYVGLGDPDHAMEWLDKAYASRFNPSILLRPAFDSLRSDTRFQDLRRRIGLPQ